MVVPILQWGICSVLQPLQLIAFMDVCKVLVNTLYDRMVYMPRTAEEWNDELKGFIENWEFPCIGAWDSFHVSSFYSYKNRYSVTNMGFTGHNKTFMFAAVGALGSTRDSRLLQNCDVYSKIDEGNLLPKSSLNLHAYGKIPLTTVGDLAFPTHTWLLKPYPEGVRMSQKRCFNRRLLRLSGLKITGTLPEAGNLKPNIWWNHQAPTVFWRK